MEDKYMQERQKMVNNYILPVVQNSLVIEAFKNVPRHEFVIKGYEREAYLDIALPIGEGQTISQPSLVALMTDLLNINKYSKVLEIGTGSGYQAAVLSQIADQVFTIERIAVLAERARRIFEQLGYKNIHTIFSDGNLGYQEEAPYDAIIITAAAKTIPQKLIDQVKEGGRIVAPVGEDSQVLQVGSKHNGELMIMNIEPVVFVPLREGTEE